MIIRFAMTRFLMSAGLSRWDLQSTSSESDVEETDSLICRFELFQSFWPQA